MTGVIFFGLSLNVLYLLRLFKHPLKSDVLIQADVHASPVAVWKLAPPMNEAQCYKNVRLWADGIHCRHLVLATVDGAKDSWAVITDENLRFRPSTTMG